MELSPGERHAVDSALNLYKEGWFPMAREDGADPIGSHTDWVQPHRRALIPLDRFHTPRRLADRVRAAPFFIRSDTAFGEVIRACAAPRPGREETWINDQIIAIFDLLHRAGHAHSVEAWAATPAGDVLVGGVYGLSLGSAFAGESMFSRPELGGTDASKVCLVHLVHHLRARGFEMFDAQLANPHTAQFGLEEISAAAYLKRLHACAARSRSWTPFEPGVPTRAGV